MDALASTEIHLWMTFYAQIPDERLHGAYWSLLSDAEKDQQRRFYFEGDRRRYLVTRALVRTVLSRYAPIEPTDWRFSVNAYGRPHIANGEAEHLGLSFNISHTHELIILGVTRRRALGVDVEHLGVRKAPVEIADHFFAPVEVGQLTSVPPDRQHYRFFEYWTFKEAYIKARGMGLSLPLDKFSFRFPNERTVRLSVDKELEDAAERWRFWQLRPSERFLVALCAEELDGTPPDIICRETVPLASERLIECPVLRTSA